jgi:hypothetical protein
MSVHEKLDQRDLRYLKFVFGRAQGAPDREIVEELNEPDIDSPQVLFRQLSRDGYPVCSECGKAPVKGKHCEQPSQKRRRRARRGTGEAIELPPAAAAVELLRPAIDKLGSSVSLLYSRREFYRDERFETVSDYPSASRTYRRAELPPGEEGDRKWRELCEEHNQDPSSSSIFVLEAPTTFAEGATQSPPWPLTELIALYVLVGKPLDPLLEVLHPDPAKVDEERLHKAIEALRLKAGQLATRVRGGIVRTGPSTGELSPLDQNAARFINRRAGEDASETETRKLLKELGISSSEFTRLKNLKIEPPQ